MALKGTTVTAFFSYIALNMGIIECNIPCQTR